MAVKSAMFVYEVVIEKVKSFVDVRHLLIKSEFADIFALELKDPKQMNIVIPDPPPLPPEPPGKKKKKKKKPKPKKKKKKKKGKEPPPPPEPIIQAGQSVLFTSTPEFLIQTMKNNPMIVSLWAKDDGKEVVGSTKVTWDPAFITYCESIYMCKEAKPVTVRDEYNVWDEASGKLMATIGLCVKLSYMTDMITASFRTLSEDEQIRKVLYTGMNSKKTSYMVNYRTTDANFIENCNKVENNFLEDRQQDAEINHYKEIIGDTVDPECGFTIKAKKEKEKKIQYADYRNAPPANVAFFNEGDYCCFDKADKPPESKYIAPETCPDVEFISDYIRKVITSCNDNMRMLTPRPTIKPRFKATDIDRLCYCRETRWPDGELAQRFKKEVQGDPCPLCINAVGREDAGHAGGASSGASGGARKGAASGRASGGASGGASRAAAGGADTTQPKTFDIANIRGPCGRPDCKIARELKGYIEKLVEEDNEEVDIDEIRGPCGSTECTLADKLQKFLRHEGIFSGTYNKEGLSTQCDCVQKMQQALLNTNECDSTCSKDCAEGKAQSDEELMCEGPTCPFRDDVDVHYFTVQYDFEHKNKNVHLLSEKIENKVPESNKSETLEQEPTCSNIQYADYRNAPGVNVLSLKEEDRSRDSSYKKSELSRGIESVCEQVYKTIATCNDNLKMLTSRPTIKLKSKVSEINNLCDCDDTKKIYVAKIFKPIDNIAKERDNFFDIANLRGPCGKPDCRIARNMRSYLENLVVEDNEVVDIDSIHGPCGSTSCTVAKTLQKFIRHEEEFNTSNTKDGQCRCSEKIEEAVLNLETGELVPNDCTDCEEKDCANKPKERVYAVYYFTVDYSDYSYWSSFRKSNKDNKDGKKSKSKENDNNKASKSDDKASTSDDKTSKSNKIDKTPSKPDEHQKSERRSSKTKIDDKTSDKSSKSSVNDDKTSKPNEKDKKTSKPNEKEGQTSKSKGKDNKSRGKDDDSEDSESSESTPKKPVTQEDVDNLAEKYKHCRLCPHKHKDTPTCSKVTCGDEYQKKKEGKSETKSPADSDLEINLNKLHNPCCIKTCGVSDTIRDYIEDIATKRTAKSTFSRCLDDDPCYCDCSCTFEFSSKTTYCAVCGGYECLGEDVKNMPDYCKPHPCPIYHKMFNRKWQCLDDIAAIPEPQQEETLTDTKQDVLSIKTNKSVVSKHESSKKTVVSVTTKEKNEKINLKEEKPDRKAESKKEVEKKVVKKDARPRRTAKKQKRVEIQEEVPGNMGWLWNAEDVPGLEPRPDWRPGAAHKKLVRKYRQVRQGADIIAKKKKALAASKKKKIEMKPLIVVKKTDGEYIVQMETFKKYSKERLLSQYPYEEKPPLIYSVGKTEKEKLKIQKKKERRERRETRKRCKIIQSTFRDQCQEICLKAYKQCIGELSLPDLNKPCCECSDEDPKIPTPVIDSCSCSESGSLSSEDTDGDDWIIEFTPPVARWKPKAKAPVCMTDNCCQYCYLDFKVKVVDKHGNQVPRFFCGPDGKQECSDLGGFWGPGHVWLEINKDGYIGPDCRWVPQNFQGPDGAMYTSEEGKFTDTSGRVYEIGIDGYVNAEGKWVNYCRARRCKGQVSQPSINGNKAIDKCGEKGKGAAKSNDAKGTEAQKKTTEAPQQEKKEKAPVKANAKTGTGGKRVKTTVMRVEFDRRLSNSPFKGHRKSGKGSKKLSRYEEIMEELRNYDDIGELQPTITKTNRATTTTKPPPKKKSRFSIGGKAKNVLPEFRDFKEVA